MEVKSYRPHAGFFGLLLALFFNAGSVSANAEPLPGCPYFQGEIISAEDYGRVVVYRSGKLSQPVKGSPSLGLFPGDVLRVLGPQSVWIRDTPNGRKRRITEADMEVTIATPETCSTSRPWFDIVVNLLPMVSDYLTSPVAVESRATVPRGENGKKKLKVNLAAQLMFSDGVENFSFFWQGQPARVSIRSGEASFADLGPSDKLSVELVPFDRALAAGQKLTLRIETADAKSIHTVTVTQADKLPMPEGAALRPDSSADDRTAYALWLALKGPPEWRLEGYSRLAQASAKNYTAWKIWQGLKTRDNR